MKNLRLFFAITALTLGGGNAYAQNLYFPEKEGTVLEYAVSNADGAVTGYITSKVVRVENAAEGLRITMLSESMDVNRQLEKEFPYMQETWLVTGDNVVWSMGDMSAAMDEAIAEVADQYAGSGIEIKAIVEVDDIVYPSDPFPGQKLAPGTMKISVKYGNGKKDRSIKIATAIIDGRTVEGTERITTQVGEFDCIKISNRFKTKAMMGLVTLTEYNTTWYAGGIGEVMSRDTDKKGRLISETKLISITN